jgi:hypothetical protein
MNINSTASIKTLMLSLIRSLVILNLSKGSILAESAINIRSVFTADIKKRISLAREDRDFDNYLKKTLRIINQQGND